MASTKRVIKAVVKNIPKAYLKAKENCSLSDVACFSMWVKWCKKEPITNLLNRITKISAVKTMIVACVIDSSYSTIWVFHLRIK